MFCCQVIYEFLFCFQDPLDFGTEKRVVNSYWFYFYQRLTFQGLTRNEWTFTEKQTRPGVSKRCKP